MNTDDLKNERLEILRKVENGQMTAEQADTKLLGLSIVSSRSISDAQRICKFYIDWMDNREKNGEEMFGIDYQLRYAAERFLNESNGC